MSDLTKLLDAEILLWNSKVAGQTDAGATQVSHNVDLPSGITGNFFISFITPKGSVAHAYVPAGAATNNLLGDDSADATKLKFISDTGFDITSLAGSPIDLPNGTKIRANVDQVLIRMIIEFILGQIASGGQGIIIGDETDSTATIYHKTTSATLGFLRKDFTSGKAQFSNNGAAWVDLDNAGVGTITWGNALNSLNGNADPYVDLAGTPAFLTGGSNAQSTPATWAAVTDGSFRITIDGTATNIDGVNFSADVSMNDVAATLQTALRAATGGLETVVWDTDHFVITSGTTISASEVSVFTTSTGTVGTDISGAGAADWMDCDTGNGTVTEVVTNSGLQIVGDKLALKKTLEDIYLVDTGAADAYVVTPTPAVAAYAAGQRFTFKATNANTGASTLDVSGLGVKTIKKFTDQDLEAGDLEAGSIVEVVYDGTNLQLVSPVASAFTKFNKFTATGTWAALAGLSAETLVQATIDASSITTGLIEIQKDSVSELIIRAGKKDASVQAPAVSLDFIAKDGGYNIGGGAYDSKTFDTVNEATFPQDISISKDGTKMYVVNIGGVEDKVFEYDLGTPYDISSAVYNSVFLSFSAQDAAMTGIFISPDGTKMYLTGPTAADKVYQYTFAAPWDLSTATYDSKSYNIGTTFPSGLVFSKDGTKLLIIDSGAATVRQHTLSTPWDVSTAKYDSISFATAPSATPFGIALNDDGTKLFIADIAGFVYQYSLPIPWTLLNAISDGVSLDLTAETTNATGIVLDIYGQRLYAITGSVDPNVYQYDISETFAGIGYASINK